MAQLSTKMKSKAEFLLTNSILSLKSPLSSSKACDSSTSVESNPSNRRTLYDFPDEVFPYQKGSFREILERNICVTSTSWQQSISLF
jgi:hypothetical protein